MGMYVTLLLLFGALYALVGGYIQWALMLAGALVLFHLLRVIKDLISKDSCGK